MAIQKQLNCTWIHQSWTHLIEFHCNNWFLNFDCCESLVRENRICSIATCMRGGPWFCIGIFCGCIGRKLPGGAFGGIIMRGGCDCGCCCCGGKLPCIGCIGAWPRGAFACGGIGRVFCWLSNWAKAAFVGNVTIGFWPCSSLFGKRSKHMRILASEPSVITQNPFDWPLARFSKNFTSWKSPMPTELTASVTSLSVVHWMK